MLPFLAFPYEVQLHIALCTACIEPLGPPTHLPALFASCRAIYDTLGRSHELYARIFRAKFDVSAAHRRLGPIALLSKNLSAQLKLYCTTLKNIRRGDIFAPTLERDLWETFMMLMESDGKNFIQLVEYAQLPSFADRLVRRRLNETQTPGGWPVENNITSLAAWLLWMVTERNAMMAESDAERESLIRMLLPYILCCFRYNSFHAADIHYVLPLWQAETPNLPSSVQTAHGPYPHYPPIDAWTTLTHFNQLVRVARPPIVQAIQLVYFARRELRGLFVPTTIPRDREHALQQGQPTGPTQADYREFNAQPAARLLDWAEWNWRQRLSTSELEVVDEGIETFPSAKALSARWDADWNRLTGCYNPYASPTSGAFARYAWKTLIGRWGGRMLISAENSYMAMIQSPEMPAGFGESHPWTSIRPLLLTLREYHCISPEEPVDFRGATAEHPDDEGVKNAYLPHLDMLVENDSVVFTKAATPNGERIRYRYERVDAGQPSSHNEETCEYCLNRRDSPDMLRTAHSQDIESLFEEAGVGTIPDTATENLEEDEGSDSDSTADSPLTYEGPCHGVLDIVFTGLTEERHGNAWCHYMYYGRVREWDGLIVLVGVPLFCARNCARCLAQNDVNESLWGRWVFRGYLHGGQNFTGRWRHIAYDLHSPGYEGAFSLSKREDLVT